ncbi:MAG: thymidylate synthase [Candidatus Bathyarchaeia archaeon]
MKVFTVIGKNLPTTWEEAVLKTWMEGSMVYTEYGQWSRDCTMLMVVEEPFSEPRIHLGGLCGGLGDLARYVREVVEGSEDHYVYEGRRPYEYHERLFNYTVGQSVGIDQVELLVKKLCEKKTVEFEGGRFTVYGCTRRAQAITWKPSVDPNLEHPPCLQRVWFRIVDSRLVMEACWRSRDAYKAAFWNMFALTELQRSIARRVSETISEDVEPGAYVDFTNSFHIYERDFEDFDKRFLKLVRERTIRERTMETDEYLKHLSRIGVTT